MLCWFFVRVLKGAEGTISIAEVSFRPLEFSSSREFVKRTRELAQTLTPTNLLGSCMR